MKWCHSHRCCTWGYKTLPVLKVWLMNQQDKHNGLLLAPTVDGTQMGEGKGASCWKGYGLLTVQQCNKISQQGIDPWDNLDDASLPLKMYFWKIALYMVRFVEVLMKWCLHASPPGFNPVWEETLSFTLHMAEVVLVRFLVWDHDPIGRDFIGQRTVAFSSLMPG